jgi:fumarylacetoacetase
VTARTWVDVPDGSPFPIENLPYGVFSTGADEPRVGVAIGEHILDLARATGDAHAVFAAPSLNGFMALGPTHWRETRERLTELLTDERHRPTTEPALVPMASARLALPFAVGDYVDFYSSIDHAQNLGRIFRPDQEPLTPNWRHLPIGYHGRSGTVVVSGTPILRPCGQRITGPGAPPELGPSRRLDIEAEVGFVVGVGSRLGRPVAVDEFRDHVFGVVLVDDWSARDIQAWEYVPLGPFLGKSFATSVSPWVVTLDALDDAWVPAPAQDPEPLPYLQGASSRGLDLSLEVRLNGELVSRPRFAAMYWTPAQQLAHLTVNGASVRTGDLYASGTVSGPTADERGSFIELSWNGSEPLSLVDGSTRTFLEDGDTVAITATAPGRGGVRIGFGQVTGTIVAAPPRDGARSSAPEAAAEV